MPLLMLFGVALGLLMQSGALILLGAGWAGAYDVSGGDCGYDGTCSDAHSLSVTAVGWLALVVVEGVAGALSAWVAWRKQRDRIGDEGFLVLLAVRGVVAVGVGCAASWVLGIQAGVVSHVAADRYPASDALQGRFFITWNARAMVGELLVALAVCLAVGLRRRTRHQSSARPAA